MTRREELYQAAESLGLYVRTYSPGDGITRYRFFTNPANSYFGPENGIGTALGLRDAETFVGGFARAAALADSVEAAQ